MADMSPEAQAVFDAANRLPGYVCHGPWIADALEALASQIVFEDQLGLTAYGGHAQACNQILAIAAELRAISSLQLRTWPHQKLPEVPLLPPTTGISL